MTGRALPSVDLIVATVDRVDALDRLLESLERQTHAAVRVLLVDQNDDGRLEPVLRRHESLRLERLHAPRGLSRARNTALPHVSADVVAFPDDDCVLPEDVLSRVAQRFADDPSLDGLTGRATDAGGESSASWSRAGAILTRENLWNRAISFTIFVRTRIAIRIGQFDEALGLGSGNPWSSGEEIDYLVRGLDAGAHIEYDPGLVIIHDDRILAGPDLSAVAARDGASIGYILRKHSYPPTTVGRMLVRPVGGALLALARRDTARARIHLSTLRGRLQGYRAA